MKITAILFLSFFFLAFFWVQPAFGHKPVIVKTKSSKQKPVQIKKPEISYAYYGRLAGWDHYYRIESAKPFLLYVNILVPDYSPKTEPIDQHDMSFEVWKDNILLFSAEGMKSSWKRFYEKYGHDNYYLGPEFEQEVEAGTYIIRVYNSNNMGKYSLAVGKKEKFTIFSLIGALFKAKSLDRWFFKNDKK